MYLLPSMKKSNAKSVLNLNTKHHYHCMESNCSEEHNLKRCPRHSQATVYKVLQDCVYPIQNLNTTITMKSNCFEKPNLKRCP